MIVENHGETYEMTYSNTTLTFSNCIVCWKVYPEVLLQAFRNAL